MTTEREAEHVPFWEQGPEHLHTSDAQELALTVTLRELQVL